MSKDLMAVASRCSEMETAAAEQQPRYSDIPVHCGSEHQQSGLSNLSLLVAVKTSLAAASTLCLSQTEHEIQNSTYCSQFELSRCGENPIYYS